MIRFIRKGTLTAALIGFGFAPALSLAGPFAPKNTRPAAAKSDPAKDEQVVIVREPGKPERACVLLTVEENPDGSKTYHVRAKDNGQLLKVHQRSQPSAEKSDVEQAGGLRRSIPVQRAVPNPSTVEPPELPSLGETPSPAASNKTPTQTIPNQPSVPPVRETSSTPRPLPPIPDNMPAPSMIQPAPSLPEKSAQPRSGGLLRRLFGKTSADEASTCAECEAAKVRPTPAAPTVQPPVATTTEPPLEMTPSAPTVKSVATISEPPMDAPPPVNFGKGVATIGGAPTAGQGRAVIDSAVPAYPMPSTSAYEPVSIAGGGANPALPPDAAEMARFQEMKKDLVGGLRPTQRMAAADAMLAIAPGRLQEVRETLMAAAQDDPAGCVRATAIQSLAKLRTRGDAYKTLLDTAMEDEDTEVREVAKYALEKLKK